MRLKTSKSKNATLYYVIKDFTNIKGKRTTKIFEKLGNQEQVEKRFGKINTINKIKEYINELNKEDKDELLKREYNPNKRITPGIKRQFNVGYLFLQKLYNQLKINDICNSIQDNYQFHFDLNEILSYLVFARIIYPSSKLETFKQCQNFIEQPKFNLHDEYRALSYIAENMDFIQESLFNNSKKVVQRNSNIIYYDCTNYFFEIDNEDDIRKYGISKEHKPNPIVGMGLFMDGDGLPLSCNIYPGNMNEQKTLIPEETKIVDNFKMDSTKIILCTDAGLASDEIKKFNVKDNRGFVITQSLKKLKDEYKQQVFNKSGWRIANDLRNVYNLNTIENDEELKEKYYDTLFYKIIETETKSVKQDLIITFCFRYYDYNRNIRNNQIERAKKSIETNNVTRKGKNQNDYRRLINSISSTDNGEIAENKYYTINQELIEEEEKYDGYYSIVSSELNMTDKELRKRYRGLSKIEETFKITKTELETRPVYVWTKEHIESHFLTCFVALVILRLLEQKTNKEIPVNQLVESLKQYNCSYIDENYYQFKNYTEIIEKLSIIFNIDLSLEYQNKQNIKKILNY